MEQNSAEALLDEVVCSGVAIDVFHADFVRRLFEELDDFVQPINKTGIGKVFFANLQIILERHLYLSLMRLYEPYSKRNPGRSIPAAVHLISSRAADLRIIDRKALVDYLTGIGGLDSGPPPLRDEEVSLRLAACLEAAMPKADSSSDRPLDQALAKLKAVRDKMIAHPDGIDPVSILVPEWPKIAELIQIADRFVVLVAQAYLGVHHDLTSDTGWPVTSLRRLLKLAGLEPGAVPSRSDAT
jgi:hypothetical protein